MSKFGQKVQLQQKIKGKWNKLGKRLKIPSESFIKYNFL